MAKLHKNKAIREALEYALENGFVIHPAGSAARIKFTLYCPESSREGCKIRVYSTPRSPEVHAKDIRGDVDNCLEIHPRPGSGDMP